MIVTTLLESISLINLLSDFQVLSVSPPLKRLSNLPLLTLCWQQIHPSSTSALPSVVTESQIRTPHSFLSPERSSQLPPKCHTVQFSSVAPSCPTPGVYPNSCPLSRWCHPTTSSSVIPFSSCLQSFPASGSFQMSQFFASGGQRIGVSALASVPPMNIQDWFPLGCCTANWKHAVLKTGLWSAPCTLPMLKLWHHSQVVLFLLLTSNWSPVPFNLSQKCWETPLLGTVSWLCSYRQHVDSYNMLLNNFYHSSFPLV